MRRTSRSPRRTVGGATPWPSLRADSFMAPRCDTQPLLPWAMLARSFRSAEAPRVGARRDADDAPKVPVELALVAEADSLRGLRDEHATPEQLPGAGHPEVGQVLVGRQPDFGAKGAHQVELVERRMLG